MARHYDFMNILLQDNRYTVKGYDTWPAHSVMAGQTRISFIDSYTTLEEAQKNYPDAELSHEFLQPQNNFRR